MLSVALSSFVLGFHGLALAWSAWRALRSGWVVARLAAVGAAVGFPFSLLPLPHLTWVAAGGASIASSVVLVQVWRRKTTLPANDPLIEEAEGASLAFVGLLVVGLLEAVAQLVALAGVA